MTALALAPEGDVRRAGHRLWAWRILPFETLQDEESYRLCATGRYGLPKVWEPRAATTAVYWHFGSTQEAPWPDCDCGFYAVAVETLRGNDPFRRSAVDSVRKTPGRKGRSCLGRWRCGCSLGWLSIRFSY